MKRFPSSSDPSLQASDPSPEPRLHVVLVHPEIPANAANAGRTCLAAGARLHLIRPLGFSLASRHVRRAGLDYWPQVDLELWDRWPDFHTQLPQLGSPIAITPEAPQSLWDLPLPPRPPVLLFGSEGSGLPRELRDPERIPLAHLPMEPEVRSLNLSTTVGIAVYEILRKLKAYSAR
ncbi:MAG: TrmH family RNA methyltransferase [Acidobacteriota bacterium]